MKLILLGAPGAGKGTQAEIISKRLGIPTISTGNILRAAIKDNTPVGQRAKVFMDAGRLVPDEIITDILSERLSQPDCADGYILDGVPRTIAQAEHMENIGIRFDAVLSFEIADEEIEARMSGRRTCPQCGATYHVVHNPPEQEGRCNVCGGPLIQREDDKQEKVHRRLMIYHTQTEPLKEFYAARGVLRRVDNQPTIEATTTAVMDVLGQMTRCR